MLRPKVTVSVQGIDEQTPTCLCRLEGGYLFIYVIYLYTLTCLLFHVRIFLSTQTPPNPITLFLRGLAYFSLYFIPNMKKNKSVDCGVTRCSWVEWALCSHVLRLWINSFLFLICYQRLLKGKIFIFSALEKIFLRSALDKGAALTLHLISWILEHNLLYSWQDELKWYSQSWQQKSSLLIRSQWWFFLSTQ